MPESPKEFFNPYAFVPSPPRRDKADGRPDRLGVLDDDRWTGRLRVRMTARTPLLVTEQGASGTEARRRTRRIHDKVAVPATAVKGMLRSEFEMVTNSRFGVFDEHERRLGYRTSTDDSKSLVPVRIVDEEGAKKALPLRGMHGPDGEVLLPAAWVPTYGSGANDVLHGSPVWAWVVLVRRAPAGQREQPFHYWQVTTIGTQHSDRPRDLLPGSTSMGKTHTHEIVDGTQREIRGWYFHSNRNINNKHDERVFFDEQVLPDDPSTWHAQPLGDDVPRAWSDLITSYHDAHDRADIHERPRPHGGTYGATQYINGKPGNAAWSWHLVVEEDDLDALRSLPDGTLCYAKYEGAKITALYPVALSRELYETSPQDLAEAANIAPARELGELSPADRLFGWVARGRHTDRDDTRGLRGRVRVGPVRPVGAVEIEDIDRGLAILAAPRPTQDLFYAAENPEGKPLRSGRGYRPGQGLRGRKVYPHQPATTWDVRDDQSWLRRAGDEPEVGTQNARLMDWVATGSVFEFDIDIENATPRELGALLYVLQGKGTSGTGTGGTRLHKLGGGKPLGFGSVTLDVCHDESDLRGGRAWRSWFALDDETEETTEQLDESSAVELVRAFLRGQDLGGRAVHLEAYEHYLTGFPDTPAVHYPAQPADPSSEKERYKWFVDNRKARQPRALGRLENNDIASLRLPTDPNREHEQRPEDRRSPGGGR